MAHPESRHPRPSRSKLDISTQVEQAEVPQFTLVDSGNLTCDQLCPPQRGRRPRTVVRRERESWLQDIQPAGNDSHDGERCGDNGCLEGRNEIEQPEPRQKLFDIWGEALPIFHKVQRFDMVEYQDEAENGGVIGTAAPRTNLHEFHGDGERDFDSMTFPVMQEMGISRVEQPISTARGLGRNNSM